MRPIGIGEVPRRIIVTAATSCLRSNMINTNVNWELRTRIRPGCNIAAQASVNMFEEEENYGILQTDASNAFNSINRAVITQNSLLTRAIVIKYLQDRLYQVGKKYNLKGTLLLCACATGVFPLLPLNETSNEMNERTKRLDSAEHFTGAGKLHELRSW